MKRVGYHRQKGPENRSLGSKTADHVRAHPHGLDRVRRTGAPGRVDGLDGAGLGPSAATVAGGAQRGGLGPGQCLDLLEQGLLVAFDGQNVVGVQFLDQVGGGAGPGVQGIGGDHHAGQVHAPQQGGQGIDLAGARPDPYLGDQVPVRGQGGEQVHRGIGGSG
jgi:hypothetical protein